jgi:Asp/Glu/hydantoin racemase
MRIGVVHVTTEAASGPYTDLITENLERAKSPGTEVLHRYVAHIRRASDTAIAYPTLLNRVDVASEIVALEGDGADAVLVACSGDTAVSEARSLVSIPVIGPMEATMLLACSYGWRFGILTVEDRTWASWMDQAVHINGLSDRYIGLRRLHTPTSVVFTEGFRNPGGVRQDMEARANELVAAGAESIVIGSAGLSTFASSFGWAATEDPEVPVFDVISVGLKFAELRASLQQQLGVPPVSRAGWHARFAPSDRERVDQLFGWPSGPPGRAPIHSPGGSVGLAGQDTGRGKGR